MQSGIGDTLHESCISFKGVAKAALFLFGVYSFVIVLFDFLRLQTLGSDEPIPQLNENAMNTNLLIQLDWLTINYDLPLAVADFGKEFQNKGYEFVQESYTTRHFKTIVRVNRGYDELFVILANPFSKVLPANLIQVKISNKLFYWGSWIEELRRLKQALGLRYRSISRIDICVDWLGYDVLPFVKEYRSGAVRMKSPKKTSEFYTIEKGELKYEGVKFGSPISAYTFKIYNKTKEILEESFKYYIIEWWEWNWCQEIREDVFRFEFSITEVPKIVFSSGELMDDENISEFVYQKELLQMYLEKIRFYYYTGKSRQDREQTYDLLPPASITPAKSVKFASTAVNTRTAKVICNVLIQKLLTDSLTNSEAFNIYKTIFSMVREYHLSEWFLKFHEDNDKAINEKYILKCMATGMLWANDLFGSSFSIISEELKYELQKRKEKE